MDLNIYYLAGMACGVIAVAVILWVLNSWANKKNQGPMEFDEMQLIARQKAAMHGFCVLVVLSLLFGGLAPRTILDGYSAMFIAAFAGLRVFACECVIGGDGDGTRFERFEIDVEEFGLEFVDIDAGWQAEHRGLECDLYISASRGWSNRHHAQIVARHAAQSRRSSANRDVDSRRRFVVD